MKFAHMADCHIGAWRMDKLKSLVSQAFAQAIQTCIQEQVDFVLIAGDLFNTAMPHIDAMHDCVKQLSKLKDHNIPVYLIAGSHDYAPNGKTMLDVLETTGLFTNVYKPIETKQGIQLQPTIDPKTKTKIQGVLGKAGMLDKIIYEQLAPQQQSNEYSIFLFHTAISELTNNDFGTMHTHAKTLLPAGHNYYAGGHVHIVKNHQDYQANIVYPGPLFPADFAELESLSHGGFFIVEVEQQNHVRRIDLKLKNHHKLTVDIEHKTPQAIHKEIFDQLQEVQDAIITIRFEGNLHIPMSQLELNELSKELYNKGAYAVLKHTNGIKVPELEDVQTNNLRPEEIEQQHFAQLQEQYPKYTQSKALLEALSQEKIEGETKADYEQRIRSSAKEVLGMK